MVSLRQELSRRENALEEELKTQEIQQKSAKELWETRLRELEKQWADKRKAWEDAMKSTEAERLHLTSSFQERQNAWALEQERPRAAWWSGVGAGLCCGVGYLVRPESIEFWQGRENRMHDRFLYTRDTGAEDGWSIERLAP